MPLLPTVWFVVIAILWSGYLFLEGFDLGVGMHLLFSTRDDSRRRTMLNAIGPVWDGNEVWLVTAIGATFAAFPEWYGSLLSGLYLPLVVVLLGLIFRAVSIEWRGKGKSIRWTRSWDRALGLGSLITAFGIGMMLAITTTGLPIDANGDRVGGAFAWITPLGLLGGVAVVAFSLLHGAAFLALKTDGPVRHSASRFAARWTPMAIIPLLAWVAAVQFRSGTALSWGLLAVAVLAAALGIMALWRTREGWGFIGSGVTLVVSMAAIFTAAFPTVLPSTISSSFDLTVANASSSPYTLGVMTVVACVGVPLVLAYQGWTYWVFRARLRPSQIAVAHAVEPAVRRAS